MKLTFVPCEACEGTGREEPFCDTCNCNGWVDDPTDGGTMTCPDCDDTKCSECGGEGMVER